MMWQSSMLISLLVLSPEQIYVTIWVSHGPFYRGPITLFEPLVVLVGRHNAREKELKKGEGKDYTIFGSVVTPLALYLVSQKNHQNHPIK
jgi:hypothetical protein